MPIGNAVGLSNVAVVLGGLLFVACAPPEPTRRVGSSTGKTDKAEANNSATPTNENDPGATKPGSGTTPTDPGTPEPDGDGDGIPDVTDCDPASATLAGTKLLDDPLTADHGLFAAADGFSQASWSYDGTGYRQVRLADLTDTSVFLRDSAVGDAVVEVRAASTEVGTFTPRLRQMFVLFGTTITGGVLSAVGCGVEVVGGEATEQKTSVVRLNGSPAGVTTSALKRVDRGAVQAGEEFGIKARLAAGTLTCEVVIKGVTTTATATGLGPLSGSIGLFTRQTKALYKQAKICKLKT